MEPALGDWGVPFGGRTSALLAVCGEDASASTSDGGRAAATPGAVPQKEHRRPRRAGDQIAPRPHVALVTNHERSPLGRGGARRVHRLPEGAHQGRGELAALGADADAELAEV